MNNSHRAEEGGASVSPEGYLWAQLVIRQGQVAIWENQGQKGPFHTVTVSRSYYDEEWKHTDNFTAGDLLTLAF